MKKPFIVLIVLAAAAGASGVLIGMAIAHMRHGRVQGPLAGSSGITAAGAESSGINAKEGDQPDVIRFAKDPSPTPPFLVLDLGGHSVSTAQLPRQSGDREFLGDLVPTLP